MIQLIKKKEASKSLSQDFSKGAYNFPLTVLEIQAPGVKSGGHYAHQMIRTLICIVKYTVTGIILITPCKLPSFGQV